VDYTQSVTEKTGDQASDNAPVLVLENVHTYVGSFHILQGVGLAVRRKHITVLLGRNGAGKTTTVRTIMGLAPRCTGSIRLAGREIRGLAPDEIARRGVAYVPEDAGIFPHLTVAEHLMLVSGSKGGARSGVVEEVMELFPDLKQAWRKRGGALSGGQRQMLAVARAYAMGAGLLVIDEPSKGLAPVMVERLMDSLVRFKNYGSVLLVEQNFSMASRISDDFYLIDHGTTISHGPMAALVGDRELQHRYLGI